jgi:hypothetical protein
VGVHVLHAEVSRMTGDPLRLGDAVRHIADEARPAGVACPRCAERGITTVADSGPAWSRAS